MTQEVMNALAQWLAKKESAMTMMQKLKALLRPPGNTLKTCVSFLKSLVGRGQKKAETVKVKVIKAETQVAGEVKKEEGKIL